MRMNLLKVGCLLLGVVLIAGSTSAGTIIWQDSIDYVFRRSGVGGGYVVAANNWLTVLYQDTGANGIGAYGAADDVIIHSSTTWGGDGWFLNQLSGTSGGFSVFARVFDASTEGAASWYVNLSTGIGAIPVLGVTDTYTFDTGGATTTEGSGLGQWQVVPEPGTFALFGLGLLTIAARRRFRK